MSPGVIQRSFVAGEVTPMVRPRHDVERLTSSLKTCRNFYVQRHGGAANRSGTQHCETSIATSRAPLSIPWVFSADQSYVVEFGWATGTGGYMRILQDGAYLEVTSGDVSAYSGATDYVAGDIVTDGGSFYLAVTPVSAIDPSASQSPQKYYWYLLPTSASGAYLQWPTPYGDDLERLYTSQSADVMTITHGDYETFELIRLGALTWTFLPRAWKPSQAPPTAITTVSGGTGGAQNRRYKVVAVRKDTFVESVPGQDFASLDLGLATMPAVGDPFEITASTAALTTGDEITITTVTVSTADAMSHAALALENTSWRITVTSGTTFTLDDSEGLFGEDAFRVAEADTAGALILQIVFGTAYIEYPNATKGTYNSIFTWTAPANATEIQEYLIFRRDNEEAYGFLKAVTDTRFEDDNDYLADQSIGPLDYKNPFRFGATAADNTFPVASGYYQQRQAFTGSNKYPQRTRLSRVGDFRNFSTSSPLQDGDAVMFDIASEEANQIVGLATIGRLLILTTGGIISARGDGDGAITPTTINLETLSQEGASNLKPLVVDDRVLYAEARATYIRELRYDVGSGGYSGYAGRDLTIWASHLFIGYTIVSWAFQRVPDAIAWCVRSDGALLGFTYLPEHEIWAWHRHDTNGGTDLFKDVCVIPEDGVDVPYVVVERIISGVTTWYFERMVPRRVDNPGFDARKETLFSDCFVTYDGENATATTLTLAGGSTWAAGETGLTLTASAGIFVAGDVDNGYRIVGSDGLEVEVIVTAAPGSATVATVKLLTAAPASTRATARTTWTKMLDDITGLAVLNGRTCAILADGHVLPQAAVTAGALPKLPTVTGLLTGPNLTSNRPYGVVHVGIPITAQCELLDLDYDSRDGDAVADKHKLVNGVTLFLQNSRGVTAGVGSTGTQYDFELLPGEDERTLVTDKRLVRVDGTFGRSPTVFIQQSDPVPANVLAVIQHIQVEHR